MVSPSLSGCAMSPPIYLRCLPNSLMGCTQSVGCFSLPTVTIPSRSSTLCNATSTTIMYPINSHALFSQGKLRQTPSWCSQLFSSSSFYSGGLHATPLKAIPFSPLAILRWIIDSEPDVHFRLRPHFTRSCPCRLWAVASSPLSSPTGFTLALSTTSCLSLRLCSRSPAFGLSCFGSRTGSPPSCRNNHWLQSANSQSFWKEKTTYALVLVTVDAAGVPGSALSQWLVGIDVGSGPDGHNSSTYLKQNLDVQEAFFFSGWLHGSMSP